MTAVPAPYTAAPDGPPPYESVRPAAPPPGVLLVTGGGRGIGAQVCERAARDGWDVAVNYARDGASAERVVRAVQACGRRAIAVQADVSDAAAVAAMFGTVARELGPLRGLVNNAGIVDMKARLDEMSVSRLQRMLAVNVLGTWLCAQQAVRAMSLRHGGAGGVIVNVSSVAATLGSPATYVDYASSKGAIDTFTTGLGRELAREGIRVAGVRPGTVYTDIHADSGDARRALTIGDSIPLGRAGYPQEIAEAVVWLLSPAASYVTAATLDVGGGR